MTPARARKLSVRWLVGGLALLIAREALAAIGMDELSLPITVGMWLAFVYSASHSGWANGYEARGKDTEAARR